MGYPTKVQLIRRKKGADQYYINFPTAVAEAMEFQKGEIIEWILTDCMNCARGYTKPLKFEPSLCSTLFAATA